MAVKHVEGEKLWTEGLGIADLSGKVISILLRNADNLIQVNDDNELYTDLQLLPGITTTSTFPVGVTVGKVLAEDGRPVNGILLNFKTTSGDYGRWLYGADDKLYFDGNTGVLKQVYFASEVDDLFAQLRSEISQVGYDNDYRSLDNIPLLIKASDYDDIYPVEGREYLVYKQYDD